MTIYEAVYNRKSVRRYKQELISAQIFRNLLKFINRVTPLYPDIRYQFEIFNAMDNEGEVRGLFRVKAPYYIVLYSEYRENAAVNAGYLMEQVLLYLCTKGIGTCYQGAVKAVIPEPPEGMEQMLVAAFGYADEKLYRESAKAKRSPLDELCVYKESVSKEIQSMLQAARLAPSAFNSQPWRFVVYANRIHLFAKRNELKQRIISERTQDINLGIVTYHLALAAEELWLNAEIVELEQILERNVKNNRYILSIVISS